MARSDSMAYTPIEGVEKLHQYGPDGYHPVSLGDRLREGRYTILNKLGFGGYSTVWMARDEPAQRFVAVKIHIACVDTTEEREIMQLLADAGRNQIHSANSSQYILQVLDAFKIEGPNGSHDCLVSEPAGFSLMFCLDHPASHLFFPLEVARAISAQMILATAFIHSQGIVHGDLHLGNFLLRIPFDINALTTEQYHAKYRRHTVRIRRRDDGRPVSGLPGVPSFAVVPNGIGKVCNELTLADARVVLADFGQAWMPSKRHKHHLSTPYELRPPEGLFAELLKFPIGAGADIWTLANALYTMFMPDTLVSGSLFFDNDNNVVARCIGLLGQRPPDVWWDAWVGRSLFFDDAGNWAPKTDWKKLHPSLTSRMERVRPERREFDEGRGVALGDEEFADLTDALHRMLKWLPEDRITASQLADGTWMRNWGIPALDKVPPGHI